MKPALLVNKIRSKHELSREISLKTDEFLDVYSFYQLTKISWIHDELKLKAYELTLLDPEFSADI